MKTVRDRKYYENIYKRKSAIENQITSGKYKDLCEGISEWGGAGVIITSKLKGKIGYPSDTIVRTPYARELSWLLESLGRENKGKIDYFSKYQYYESLANLANAFIESHKKYTAEELLLNVLDGLFALI